jgi:preprotein translocase subunit SecE
VADANRLEDAGDFDPEDAGLGPRSSTQSLVEQRRESAPARLIGFLQGSWRELQRVHWPDRRQVMQATGVVLGFVVVAGIFLGVADLAASKLMNLVLK